MTSKSGQIFEIALWPWKVVQRSLIVTSSSRSFRAASLVEVWAP